MGLLALGFVLQLGVADGIQTLDPLLAKQRRNRLPVISGQGNGVEQGRLWKAWAIGKSVEVFIQATTGYLVSLSHLRQR